MAEHKVFGRGQDDFDATELSRFTGGRQDGPSQYPICRGSWKLLPSVIAVFSIVGLAGFLVSQREPPPKQPEGVHTLNSFKSPVEYSQIKQPQKSPLLSATAPSEPQKSPLLSATAPSEKRNHNKAFTRSGQKACTSKLLRNLPPLIVDSMSSIEMEKCTFKIKQRGQAQHHIDFFLGQAGFMKYAYQGSDEVFVRRAVDAWYPQVWETDWRLVETEGSRDKSPTEKQSNSLVGILLPTPPKVQAKAQADFELWRKLFVASDSNWQIWCDNKLADNFKTNCCLGNGFGSKYQQDIYIFRNLFLDKTLRGEQGVYVDSAASHWRSQSNSLFFDKCLGWKGFCLVPEQKYAAGLTQSRSCTVSSVSQFLHDTDITLIDFWNLGHGMSPLTSRLPFDKIDVMLIDNSQLSDDRIDQDHFLIDNGYAKYAELGADGLFVKRLDGKPSQQPQVTRP